MNQAPAREITPDEWLKPPVNYALQVPQHVKDANEEAAKAMNKAKDDFIYQCLEFIVPTRHVGEIQLEHLGNPARQMTELLIQADPAKITLTIRPRFNPTILIPTAGNTENPRALVSQCADVLEFHYKDQFIGRLEFTYAAGKIQIEAQIRAAL